MTKKSSKKSVQVPEKTSVKKAEKKPVEVSSQQPIYVVQAPQSSVLSQLVALCLILIALFLGYTMFSYDVVLVEKKTPSFDFDVKTRPYMPKPIFMRRHFGMNQMPVVLPGQPAINKAAMRKTAEDYRRSRGRRRRLVNPVMDEPNPPIKEAEIKSVPVMKTDSHYSCRATALRKAKYIEEEYAPYQKKGKAVIAGKVCLTLEDKTEKCFPNSRVILNPVTSYSKEWFDRGWAGKEYLEEADPRVNPTNLVRITDENGAFSFTELPAGSYYVGAEVCVPRTQDAEECIYTRLGTRVKMEHYVEPKFKKVFSVR